MCNQNILNKIEENTYVELPYAVLSNKKLTCVQKLIYALLCTYDIDNTPTVATISKLLKIQPNTYYKHINGLIELGFITITKQAHKNYQNIYTLNDVPKIYLTDKSSTGEKIRNDGIKSLGVIYISKNLIISEMGKNEKLIYCRIAYKYKSNSQEISVREICDDVGISKKTYNKAISNLTKSGVISVAKIHENGRFRHNKYSINKQFIPTKNSLKYTNK